MSAQNIDINLSGWKSLPIVLILIVIIGIRITTMGNKKDDANLVKKIKFQLMTEYLPDDANKIKNLYESSGMDKIAKAAQSVTTTKINIISLKASYSIFDFSTKEKDVVVKVKYSIDDAYGTIDKGTKYYKFTHSPMFNRWKYRFETHALNYYLNFI